MSDINIRRAQELIAEMRAKGRNPDIGQHIKVFLPGESPWAIVIGKHEDGRVQARLDNHLIGGGLHGYACGDVATFELTEVQPDVWVWGLATLDRQIPTTPHPVRSPGDPT